MAAKAVASSIKTPGFWLTVNLTGGAQAPGAAADKGLIICPKSATGTLTDDTEVRPLLGADDAKVAFGPGQGYLTAKAAFRKYGLAQIDGIAPANGAGSTASVTHVFTTAPTVPSTVTIDVAGRKIDSAWNPGESPTVARDRAVLRVNTFADDLPAIASAGVGAGDIDIDADSPGPWGNDILTGIEFSTGGTGGVVAAGAAALAGGTVEPDISNALAQIQTDEYRVILLAASNADASATGGTANPDRLRVHINQYESGLDALLQVGLVGHTGTIANVKAGAIDRNDPAYEYIFAHQFQSLPCEVAGEELGDTLSWINRRANYNRIGNEYLGLYGPKDIQSDKLTASEIEDLLNNGVSPVGLAKGSNRPFLVKPITTKSLDGANPDYRAHHMSDTYGAYFVADDVRTAMPGAFPNASITPNLPAGDTELPAGVVEIKDVKAWVISRIGLHAKNGIVVRARLEEAVASGELIVEIDDGDESQVNIFIPLKIIKPLAKFGAIVSKE